MRNDVELYPNPAKDIAIATIKKDEIFQSLSCIDINGKIHSLNYFVSESRIQLKTIDLRGGLYIIKIETNKGTKNLKLLIN